MKKLLALFLALVMALGIVACGGSSNDGTTAATQEGETTAAGGETSAQTEDGPKYGGHLNTRSATKPTGLDPLKQTGVWKYHWTTTVYETPLTRDAEDNIAPGVCEFELSDDYLDLQMWVREGATFSNGDTVDIKDVYDSINRSLTLYSNLKKYVQPYIASMEIEGDRLHIVFNKYNERVWYYMASYQTWISVLPSEICEKYAADYIVDQVEDAIGTGPYKFVDFVDSVSVTVVRNENYVPCKEGGTGFAAPKHAYLDSITFCANNDDPNAAMAVLSGEYDMTEVMPVDYMDLATEYGIVEERLPSITGTCFYFNTLGSNLCAKYPSLRKAVMAAFDLKTFLDVITDNQAQWPIDGTPAYNSIYDTDVFKNAEYLKGYDAALVQKYLDAAHAEGYKDEPIQYVFSNTRSDIPTMVCAQLDNAGIRYQYTTMEAATYTSFIAEYGNNWDFKFEWCNYAYTPGKLPTDYMVNNYHASEERDALMLKLEAEQAGSEAYINCWYDLANFMVDDCTWVYTGKIDWCWYHQATLHANDEGDVRYFFNTYWDDPENHPSQWV